MALSPFKTGNGVVLKTSDSSKYLDSDPNKIKVPSQSVYLSDAIGQGSYWDIVVLPNNRICLQLVAPLVPVIEKLVLDSSGAAPTSKAVYLANTTAGGGSHWLPNRLSGGEYTFKCDSPSGKNRYLCGNPSHRKDNSVYLAETGYPDNTHWSVLLTHYTGDSVQSIITAVYPSVPIGSCEPNGTYGSLEYDQLCSIWKDLQSSNNQMTLDNYNDFTVCLKTEVHKHSYDSDSPWPNHKGSLCGIMWGSIEGKMCALNFTIDPFQNLILFDPQNGQKIATEKFTPTFCIV